jgi:hypothetical protein
MCASPIFFVALPCGTGFSLATTTPWPAHPELDVYVLNLLSSFFAIVLQGETWRNQCLAWFDLRELQFHRPGAQLMSRTKSLIFFSCVSAVVLLALLGCHTKTEMQVEKPIPAATPQPAVERTPVPAAKLPPPTVAEVETAFHRIFGDSLIAGRAGTPVFIVGDFNGDESQDLAVVARPAAGKLDDVNSELANWTIQDADKAFIAPAGKSVVVPPKATRPKVESGEEVLTIIHGFGPTGWRSPEARQAYIVKHAPGTFHGTAPSLSQKAIQAMHLPAQTDIIEGVRQKQEGFVFWTGGVYAWHPKGT